MNSKIKDFIHNFSYALSSNLVTMVVSALTVFIIPKFLGVSDYGYWQLFLFYSSYVPFLQFGWTDGIYLRYGGLEKRDLDKKLFFSQFLSLLTIQILISLLILALSNNYNDDIQKLAIIRFTSAYMVLVNTRYFFTYILQATNRFKEYSRIIIMDRFFYVILIFLAIIIRSISFETLIYADLASKTVSLLLAVYICKDIAIHSIRSFSINIREITLNIKAGIQVMFANTAGMLIIGIIRLGIEKAWDVATFGKISLTLSISKFMMIFINAVSIVMFPVLRRTDVEKLPVIYKTLRNVYSLIIFAVLALYYPMREFLVLWLPEYSDSLIYMALLFPMSVYEGKMSLIINPYLKTLRKESILLRINLIGLLFGGIASIVSTIILKNLYAAVISIVLVLAIRTIISDVILSKILNLKYLESITVESFLVVFFIALGLLQNTLISLLLYLSVYLFYVLRNKDEILKFKKLINLK